MPQIAPCGVSLCFLVVWPNTCAGRVYGAYRRIILRCVQYNVRSWSYAGGACFCALCTYAGACTRDHGTSGGIRRGSRRAVPGRIAQLDCAQCNRRNRESARRRAGARAPTSQNPRSKGQPAKGNDTLRATSQKLHHSQGNLPKATLLSG